MLEHQYYLIVIFEGDCDKIMTNILFLITDIHELKDIYLCYVSIENKLAKTAISFTVVRCSLIEL